LKNVYQLKNYILLWEKEVAPKYKKKLPELICSSKKLQQEAWNLRNEIVHGAGSCSRKYAKPKFEILMKAAQDIRGFVRENGLDIDARLKTRKAK